MSSMTCVSELSFKPLIAKDYSSIIGYAAAMQAVPAKYKYRTTHTTYHIYIDWT